LKVVLDYILFLFTYLYRKVVRNNDTMNLGI